MDIGVKTKVRYGCCIVHGGPVVISETAQIGNSYNLSQFATIGSNRRHAVTIGNNVYIGPSVCLVEDVCVEPKAAIRACSVVAKDTFESATAVGNCTKVLSYRYPDRCINNPRQVNDAE